MAFQLQVAQESGFVWDGGGRQPGASFEFSALPWRFAILREALSFLRPCLM